MSPVVSDTSNRVVGGTTVVAFADFSLRPALVRATRFRPVRYVPVRLDNVAGSSPGRWPLCIRSNFCSIDTVSLGSFPPRRHDPLDRKPSPTFSFKRSFVSHESCDRSVRHRTSVKCPHCLIPSGKLLLPLLTSVDRESFQTSRSEKSFSLSCRGTLGSYLPKAAIHHLVRFDPRACSSGSLTTNNAETHLIRVSKSDVVAGLCSRHCPHHPRLSPSTIQPKPSGRSRHFARGTRVRHRRHLQILSSGSHRWE